MCLLYHLINDVVLIRETTRRPEANDEGLELRSFFVSLLRLMEPHLGSKKQRESKSFVEMILSFGVMDAKKTAIQLLVTTIHDQKRKGLPFDVDHIYPLEVDVTLEKYDSSCAEETEIAGKMNPQMDF